MPEPADRRLAQFNEVMASLGALATATGFRRRGTRFIEQVGEDWRILQVQRFTKPSLGPDAPGGTARASLYAEGEAGYRHRVLIAWARSGDPPASQGWRHRFALPERWQPPQLPLGGTNVMALGLPAGPRVGELLRALEAWWIAGDFAADEAALRAKLQELARQ